MIWLIAYLYLTGMLATSFILLDVYVLRRWRAAAFLLFWPVAIPFVLIGAFVE